MLRLPLRLALSWGASSLSGTHKPERRGEPRQGIVFAHRLQMIECMRVSPLGDLNTASTARSICALVYAVPKRSPTIFLRYQVSRHGRRGSFLAGDARSELAGDFERESPALR